MASSHIVLFLERGGGGGDTHRAEPPSTQAARRPGDSSPLPTTIMILNRGLLLEVAMFLVFVFPRVVLSVTPQEYVARLLARLLAAVGW